MYMMYRLLMVFLNYIRKCSNDISFTYYYIIMEKLMKYVEEMQKEWINICRPRFQEHYLLEMMLVSKHYWLIKWLVENDKIDRDEIIINSDFMPIAFDRKWEKYEWSEEKQLLMLLSISSSPIEDLISYLK